MRIDQLKLLAYGAFTDHLLNLSGPGLHLVYGRNEAGKSTALSSLNQLLYGIDERSKYSFQHGSRMRIEARLRSASGETLDIARLKARKNPLLDGAGAPLTQEDLAPFLMGITKETFTAEFALNSEELRKGGNLLASGKVDLDEALTASNSGLQLTRVLKTIGERQEQLYKRTGKLPKINAHVTAWNETNGRIRDASLRPEAYSIAERDVSEAQAELNAVKAQLGAARAEHAKLSRLEHALPAIFQRQRLLDSVAAVQAEGVIAPADVVKALPELRSAHREATSRLTDHDERLIALNEGLASLHVDDQVIQHGGEIDELVKQNASIQDAVDRRVRDAKDVDDARANAELLLREVHPQAALADAHLYQLPETVHSRAQDLHDRHRTAVSLLTQAAETVETREKRKEQADKDLSGLPRIEEISQLRAAHAAVPRELLSSLSAADEAEGRATNRHTRIFADLKLSGAELDSIAGLSVPTRQQVDEIDSRAADIKQLKGELTREQRKITTGLVDLRQERALILADDPPPTWAELQIARQDRDRLLNRVPDDLEQILHVTAAIVECDRLGDLMVVRSNQVGELSRLEHELARQNEHLDNLTRQLAELDASKRLLDEEWTALWAAYPAKAPALGNAARLLDQIDQLRVLTDELQDARASLARLNGQAEGHVIRLRDLLRDPNADTMVWLGGATILSELPELLEIAQARLDESSQAVQDRAGYEARAASEAIELDDAANQLVRQKNELADLAQEWEAFLLEALLPASQDTVTTLAALRRLADVARTVKAAEATEWEVHLLDQRIAGFHSQLEDTTGNLGITVPDAPVTWHQIVDSLHERLTEHREAARDREQLQADHRSSTASVTKARKELNEINDQLAGLVTRTGVATENELEPAVERSHRFRTAQADLDTVSATLPGGDSLDALIQQAHDTSAERLADDLRTLGESLGDLETQHTDWTAQLAGRRAQLERLDGSAQAAQASSEAAMILTDLVEETEEYLRLELARQYITTCMEEYRQQNQDPVLARAATAFRKLTLDRYIGLELSDDDSPLILAKRGDGTSLTTDRLSEGTRDQLYLALRLASLERHADTGRALPFAVDDIFMTFDDDRTIAGLHVLNDLADRFQVIVFTHHEHIAQLATAELPTDRVHLHRLPS